MSYFDDDIASDPLYDEDTPTAESEDRGREVVERVAVGAQNYETPRPKDTQEGDDLPAADPLKGDVPGTLSGDPESPHLGKRYIPGSANTTGETDVFDGSSGPPKRG
jgi:hypothetical protein